MTVALLLIATSERYWQYINPLIESAKKFFVPHETLLFTDSHKSYGADYQAYEKNLGYPQATLKRYHTFLGIRDLLEHDFNYVFYVDIDAIFVSPVGDEVFSNGITATLHQNQKVDTLIETDPRSTAYLLKADQYFCGGFNGGTTPAFLKMAETISRNVDIDESRGVLAKWHDESHLNRYLSDNPPSKVLSSDYCYPEPELHKPCNPKIVCLDKSLRGGR